MGRWRLRARTARAASPTASPRNTRCLARACVELGRVDGARALLDATRRALVADVVAAFERDVLPSAGALREGVGRRRTRRASSG